MKTCPRLWEKDQTGVSVLSRLSVIVKREMKESGYLTEPLSDKRYRGKGYRESTHETKNGKDT